MALVLHRRKSKEVIYKKDGIGKVLFFLFVMRVYASCVLVCARGESERRMMKTKNVI